MEILVVAVKILDANRNDDVDDDDDCIWVTMHHDDLRPYAVNDDEDDVDGLHVLNANAMNCDVIVTPNSIFLDRIR